MAQSHTLRGYWVQTHSKAVWLQVVPSGWCTRAKLPIDFRLSYGNLWNPMYSIKSAIEKRGNKTRQRILRAVVDTVMVRLLLLTIISTASFSKSQSLSNDIKSTQKNKTDRFFVKTSWGITAAAPFSLGTVLSITFTCTGRLLCVRHDNAVWAQLKTDTGRHNLMQRMIIITGYIRSIREQLYCIRRGCLVHV